MKSGRYLLIFAVIMVALALAASQTMAQGLREAPRLAAHAALE
jgi:hypothetical protein